jgi:TonB family protein
MNSIMEYALKAAISLTVLYLFYWLLLRKATHFRLNRIILLTSIVASVTLPFIAPKIITTSLFSISIPSLSTTNEVPDAGFAPEDSGQTTSGINSVSDTSNTSFLQNLDLWNILLIIYAIGTFVVTARLVYQAIRLKMITHKSETQNHNGFVIVSTNRDMAPFSYFNKMFIPVSNYDENSLASVIAHEKAHLDQLHYIDLMIVEIISIFQWFNPVIWLYEKAIKEVHEYLADEVVLSSGKNVGEYLALLVNQAIEGPVFILTNQFNQSLIKKRILMMKNMKTSKMAQTKALLIVPLIAGLMLAFANQPIKSQSLISENNIVISGKITDKSSGKAIARSSILFKGTSVGTIADDNGHYQIKAKGPNDEMVISHVGYQTQIITVGSKTEINIEMEPIPLTITFPQKNKITDNAKLEASHKKATQNTKIVAVEMLPTYPGGNEALQSYLASNLQYPENDKSKGIQGRVWVSCTVDVNGKITNTKVLRGVSPDIDKEAIRLAGSMTEWKPASQNGSKTAMSITIPIDFRLN